MYLISSQVSNTIVVLILGLSQENQVLTRRRCISIHTFVRLLFTYFGSHSGLAEVRVSTVRRLLEFLCVSTGYGADLLDVNFGKQTRQVPGDVVV